MSAYFDNPVKDRIKVLLLNEDMADVHFLVGIGDVKERLPAHKFVLSTASEMLHGQLHGHYEVPETIDVDDTTPEVFKVILGYIYTDVVELTRDNAFFVLYLAKKYLLNNLVARVSQFIASAYKQNIAEVLPHLDLMEGEQAECVWDAIATHGPVVLESPEFLELSHANFCELLIRVLHVDELTVYNRALAWAKAECHRRRLSFDTDARAVLGDALKLIRFPLMSYEEFASGPANSSVLSCQEKLEICQYYGPRTCHVRTTFSSTPRTRQVLACNRFDAHDIQDYNWWPNTPDRKSFFNFTVNARVFFHGVAFFGRKGESCVYEVNVSLLNASSGETLATTHAEVTTDESEDTYKVLFPRPVMIVSATKYKVTAVSIGPGSHFAHDAQRLVTCGHGHGSNRVKFKFADTGRRDIDQFDVSLRGHIPTIYFSFP